MKKFLLIAAIALASAAQAQTTVYGKIDAGMGITDVDGVRTTTANSGALNGSRLGFTGSEDIGKGMKGVYTLESGFSVDDGKSGQGSRLFGRQAFVGVSTTGGTISFGRQLTPGDTAICSWDVFGCTTNSSTYKTFASNYANIDNLGQARQDNSVKYTSPKVAGVTVEAMWAPDERTVGGQSYRGVAAGFAAGPVSVNGGFEEQQTYQKSKSNTSWTLGSKYTLMGATVSAGVAGGTSDADVKDMGYSVGASMPFGATTLTAGYASETSKTAAGAESKSSGFTVNAVQALSKRTNVYAGVNRHTNDPAVGATVVTTSLISGIVHSF